MMKPLNYAEINLDDLHFEYNMNSADRYRYVTDVQTGEKEKVSFFGGGIYCEHPQIKVMEIGMGRDDYDSGQGFMYLLVLGERKIGFCLDFDDSSQTLEDGTEIFRIDKIGLNVGEYIIPLGERVIHNNTNKFLDQAEQDFALAVIEKAMAENNFGTKGIKQADKYVMVAFKKGPARVEYTPNLKSQIDTGALIR